MVNASCISKKSRDNALQDHIWITCARHTSRRLRWNSLKTGDFVPNKSECVLDWMCVLGWYKPRKKTHTFTGCSRHFKLVHEAPELLSYSHSSQQTLVVEKMLLTPLGALLVLPERSTPGFGKVRGHSLRNVHTCAHNYTLMNASYTFSMVRWSPSATANFLCSRACRQR